MRSGSTAGAMATGGKGTVRRVWPHLLLVLPLLVGCNELPLVSNPSDRAPEGLELDLGGEHLYTGEPVQVRWSLFDEDGRRIAPLPGWVAPTITASKPIVEISGTKLNPVTVGDVRITASLAGFTASRDVRVHPGNFSASIAAAYITQVVQRLDGSIPIIAGRDAHLRVFVTGDQSNVYKPSVTARFYRNGAQVAAVTAYPALEGIPLEVQEGTLFRSWNIPVPGSVLLPGTSMLVELNGDGGLRVQAGKPIRFPASGVPRLLDIRTAPVFRITFVPIHIIGFATGDINSSNVDYYMSATRAVWPLHETDVLVREPYSTTTGSLTDQDWSDLLREIRSLRIAEGSSRYYHGILRRQGAWSGLGYVSYPAAISRDGTSTWTVAHELGHNFGRRHAPCGGPSGVDANYPHPNGGIGVYGMESNGTTLHPPTRPDLMTYCSPRWVSDYSYQAVINFRQPSSSAMSAMGEAGVFDQSAAAQLGANRANALIVSGVVDGARSVIDPAFFAETFAALPSEAGPYTLQGLDAGGATLFSFSFAGEELGEGPAGVRHFSFAIPLDQVTGVRLALLRVSGGGLLVERRAETAAPPGALGFSAASPGDPVTVAERNTSGEVVVRWDAVRFPRAVIRNAATGVILAIASGGSAVMLTGSDELEVALSDGVKSTTQVVRVR